jgi:hypothetical protein
MAEIKEYFETDFRHFKFRAFCKVLFRKEKYQVEVALIYDLDANSKYIAMYFMHDTSNASIIWTIVRDHDKIWHEPDKIALGRGFPDHAYAELKGSEKGI